MPDWKHSQYFFRQPDFLHEQPFTCWCAVWFDYACSMTVSIFFDWGCGPIFGLKALGVRSNV